MEKKKDVMNLEVDIQVFWQCNNPVNVFILIKLTQKEKLTFAISTNI